MEYFHQFHQHSQNNTPLLQPLQLNHKTTNKALTKTKTLNLKSKDKK